MQNVCTGKQRGRHDSEDTAGAGGGTAQGQLLPLESRARTWMAPAALHWVHGQGGPVGEKPERLFRARPPAPRGRASPHAVLPCSNAPPSSKVQLKSCPP